MGRNETWLRAMRAAGKGGVLWPQLGIDRGHPYRKTLSIAGDWSGDGFTAALSLEPDGLPISLTVTLGAFADGATQLTLSLSEAQVDSLPSDADSDGVEELLLAVTHTPSGGESGVFMAGAVPVRGEVN